MSKEYYSIDEALAFLANATQQPFTDRDLVDLVRREKLSLCFYVAANFGIYDREFGGWETTEKYGYHLYFHGYAKIRAFELWHRTTLPTSIGALREYERISSFSEKRRKPPLTDVFTNFEEEVVQLRGIWEWSKVRFDDVIHHHRSQDMTTPLAIEIRRDELVIPSAELQSLVRPQPALVQEEKSATTTAFHSDQLRVLLQAASRFWGNATRDQKDTHPTNAQVASWLEQHGFSPTLSNHGATIIRPDWAGKGRPPEK